MNPVDGFRGIEGFGAGDIITVSILLTLFVLSSYVLYRELV